MMSKQEMLNQKKIEAKLKAEINAKKTSEIGIRQVGQTSSQWDGMMNEDRLIRCDHYMKTGKKAKLDYIRDEVRKLKDKQKVNKVICIRAIKA